MRKIIYCIVEKMARGFQVFQNLESGNYVHLDDLKHLSDHICGKLNGDYTSNYKYWYNMYSYSNKAFIVCKWRHSKGLQPVAKWGEAICEGNLVNIFNEHEDCSCESVHFK